MKTDVFVSRHIGPRELEISQMLQAVGVKNKEELIEKTIPSDIRLAKDLHLSKAMSEQEYLSHMHKLSIQNKLFKNYIGLGYHPTITPGSSNATS